MLRLINSLLLLNFVQDRAIKLHILMQECVIALSLAMTILAWVYSTVPNHISLYLVSYTFAEPFQDRTFHFGSDILDIV